MTKENHHSVKLMVRKKNTTFARGMKPETMSLKLSPLCRFKLSWQFTTCSTISKPVTLESHVCRCIRTGKQCSQGNALITSRSEDNKPFRGLHAVPFGSSPPFGERFVQKMV